MKNLTVIIISKDDHDVIADAIESSKELTENILVIDSNSDDNTRKICRKLNVRVVRNVFKNFSDQRNFGMSYVTTEWVYYLDSDERLTPEFIEDVQRIIRDFDSDGHLGGYIIKRRTFYFGQDWNFTDKVERLFYRQKFVNWKGVVHETPIIKGEFGEIRSPILHLTHRNLSQMIRKTNEWSDYEAMLRYKNKHPRLAPWRFFRVMVGEFVKSYVQNKGYKNGTYGIIEAMYQGFSIFITYAKLWEMQEKNKG